MNPDQRMHEDARHLTELSADLGIGLLQASILFATFAGVLWGLSSGFSFRIARSGLRRARIHAVGRDHLRERGLAPELLGGARPRSAATPSAMRARRICDSRWCASTSTSMRSRSRRARRMRSAASSSICKSVLAATRRIVWGHTNLTWVTAGFGWVTIVAPILVAAPLYFMGKISFGGLMMAAGAFTQAQSSLRWFIDNFSAIADWRATLLRVASFRQALIGIGEPRGFESRISYAEGARGRDHDRGSADRVLGERRSAAGEPRVVVTAGERALILGAPGTGKTQLFRALAGLWPWGSGQIIRPAGEQIFYLPRGTPYLPRGTLREVLAYPLKAESFGQPAYARVLYRLGVERLVRLLDETHRWDRELSQDEQLCLVFARILLQNPPWVLIDGTFGTLDDDVLERGDGRVHQGARADRHHSYRRTRRSTSAVLDGRCIWSRRRATRSRRRCRRSPGDESALLLPRGAVALRRLARRGPSRRIWSSMHRLRRTMPRHRGSCATSPSGCFPCIRSPIRIATSRICRPCKWWRATTSPRTPRASRCASGAEARGLRPAGRPGNALRRLRARQIARDARSPRIR